MKRYKNWSPTPFDPDGLMDGEDRNDWLVVPVIQTRDSRCFELSNFAAALERLGGESETVEVHRFCHWGPGWFEIILVAPGTDAEKKAEEIEAALADYPLLDDEDYYRRQDEEALQTWQNCYDATERVAYIREHRRDFEFHDYADMLGCVRGKWFCGDADNLLS